MSVPLRIVFAGTPEFAATSLEALLSGRHMICAVYTQPDRPAGRGRRLTASAVKRVAERHRLPVYQPPALDDAEAQRLRALRADLMVVAAYGLLLPQAVLEAPRLGCINVHASLLPRWRGAAPIQRAIMAGDRETGVSIMQMEQGLDTGPVLHRLATPIHASDTAHTLHQRLAGLGARVLLETLQSLVEGSLDPLPQDETRATYARKLEKGEARLEWSRPAPELERCIRAFNPWPVARTTVGGEPLRIWQADLPGERDVREAPGTVLRAGRQGIEVATGEGVLRILRLQGAGGRQMGAAEFLNGHPELGIPGTILGG